MSTNRSQWFYSGILSTTTSFKGRSFEFNSALNVLRIQNDSANVLQFSIKGSDDSVVDGDVLANEELVFKNFQGNRVSIKSAGGSDAFRIWAY